jgi:exodeoxyribonuclease V alpha subunit
MLAVHSSKRAWDHKRQWYEDNAFINQLITSEDGADGSIDAAEIERIARQ